MSRQSFTQDAAFRLLDKGITRGTLTVTGRDGKTRTFAGRDEGPSAHLVVHDWRLLNAVLGKGDIGLGEAYMAGLWDSPDLVSLSTLLVQSSDNLGKLAWGSPLFQMLSVVRNRLLRRNSVRGSQRNILAHYDLGNAFYKLWLDPGLSYSSALYHSDADDLGSAQQAKYARILDRIGPARRNILEVGCGWGAFIEAAGARDQHVTALTISNEQYKIAKDRSPETSDVRLQDYRKTTGRFDAIVSIEMFEAVGEQYWPVYFKTLRERLSGKGVAVVQTIAIADDLFPTYRSSSDYIRRHIFPGGMLPSLSRFRQEAERAGLACTDVMSFGTDYARTLIEWLRRFEAAAPEIGALGYDRRFMRGWSFYLALCAGAFRTGRTNVHQIELVQRA
jgi:cyclopropane-fatty-acyl-phospholipid synthase